MNSIRDWRLTTGWVSNWTGYWLAITPVSAFLCRQDKFGDESFGGGLVSLLLRWGSCLAIGSGLFRFHIPNGVSNIYSHPHWFLGAFPISGLCNVLKIPLPFHPLQLQISTHSPGHLTISPVPFYTGSWTPLLIPIPMPSPTRFPPSIYLLWLFYFSF